MKKITSAKFNEACEEVFDCVYFCGMTIDEAMKATAEWLKNQKMYGFKEMAQKFNIATPKDVYVYGGQLAGEIEAF